MVDVHKPMAKPKLSEAERHKRFVDMAEKVGASDRPEDFDAAFEKVVGPKPKLDDDSKKRVASSG